MSDNILGDLAVAVATDIQAAARAATFGAWGTSGPGPVAVSPVELEPAPAQPPAFTNGVYRGATFKGAHPGRVGGPINPFAIVVHTTDMLPGEFAALIKAWTEKPADGACAHFVIDRDGHVWQLVPINRNGNHAGGAGHGVYVVGGHPVHPNLVAVGIEVHCAGGVRLVNGAWRLVEDGVAHGEALPADEVTPDPQRPGRGWHHMTDLQRDALRGLVRDIRGALAPMPPSTTTATVGEEVPSWAMIRPSQLPVVVGHVNLDPEHRSDPWPLAYSSGLMAELNAAA